MSYHLNSQSNIGEGILMEPISILVEKENLKAEINALSSIREALFKENKNAEAVVIINVQKRLRELL